ncbi:antigen 5 like allergen Cul n 1-like [Anopheles moucheti]|uniref:antigen 5 like allergen Cul n 1-like n=1 Tax=Anopheles moucheti TaxID=186751 RepID=UPI0022F05F76|nr:antigen 5 like allergen Cul n 1-like [Anopheles moucheti]
MFRFVLASLLLVGLFDHIYSVDYCTANLCPSGVSNVGCNPPPQTGGPGCFGQSPAVVSITAHLQTIILELHNRHRSQIASGGVSPFFPARRMPTLVWNAELASQAGHNARSCVFQHDQCRNTEDFAWAGQNLAIKQFYGQTLTVESLIEDSVRMWWEEHFDTSTAHIDSYPSNHVGPAIGHFTQMASDRTWAVGCAMQNWLEDGIWITYYFVCNYSFTNIVNQPVYVTGATASGCTTGVNSHYSGLCSENEVVQSVP